MVKAAGRCVDGRVRPATGLGAIRIRHGLRWHPDRPAPWATVWRGGAGRRGGRGEGLVTGEAVEAEGDGFVGDQLGVVAPLEDELAGHVVGDAEDGVGEHERVSVAHPA